MYGRGIAVGLQPNLVETYNNIAHLYTLKEDPPNSIKTYLVALSLEPTRAMTYYNLGTAYAENGNFREQEDAMRSCMAIFLTKWNSVRDTSKCPGGKRRLVFHWEGEKGVTIRTIALSKAGLPYGGEKPNQPLQMGPYPPFDSLRFQERRIRTTPSCQPGALPTRRGCLPALPVLDSWVGIGLM